MLQVLLLPDLVCARAASNTLNGKESPHKFLEVLLPSSPLKICLCPSCHPGVFLCTFAHLFFCPSNSFRLPVAAPSLFPSLGLPSGGVWLQWERENVQTQAPEWLALPPLLGDLRLSREESRTVLFLHSALAAVGQSQARLSPFYWLLLFCPNRFFTWLPFFLSV